MGIEEQSTAGAVAFGGGEGVVQPRPDPRAGSPTAGTFGQSPDLLQAARGAVDDVADVLGVEMVFVLVPDGSGGDLVTVAQRGLEESSVYGKGGPQPGESLARLVIERGRAVLPDDLDACPPDVRQFLARHGARTAAAFPLPAPSGVLGAVIVASPRPASLDAYATAMLAGLARQVALGLENARVHARLSAREEALARQRQEWIAALEESEDRFAKAFHLSPVAICITSLSDGVFIDVNESFEKLFGYSCEELIDTSVLHLGMYANPEDRVDVVRAVAEHGRLRDRELEVVARGGQRRDALVSLEGIELRGESALLVVVHDITARKQAEQQTARHVAELERFNRLAVGRELRMVELKRQVNDLSEQLGRPAPYDLSFLENGLAPAGDGEEG